MVRLILILKFTMAEPKGSNLSSIPDRRSFNQLEESLKLINLKNLKLLFGNIDFALDLTMDKFEISLLLFYYLIKFENYNVCPSSQTSTNESKFKVNFLRDVAQLCFSIKDALHLSRDPRHLSLAKKPAANEQIINIQRLKLYWDFRILVGLTESYLNIDLDRITPETELADMQSQNLESIRFVSPDIEATFQLVNLLKITPKHVLELCVKNDTEELEKFDENLKIWVDSVDSLQNDENISVINRLKTYYHYFKVLIHLNGSRHELKLACTSLIDTAYDIIFSGKNSEVSLENAEGLSLHSFNFHLLCMISIITLGNSGDRSRELGIKLLKISQLYQLLVAVKDVEPIICNLTKYIADNVTLSTSGDSLPQEGLALFSYSMSPSSSLFDRKGPSSVHEQQQQRQQGPDSQMPFDLSAFKMSSDSRFMIEREIPYKRRKNDSPTSSLSAISSRESSSASSKLLSISSSDTSVTPVPSLFPSATASICNDSPAAKKRRSPYSNGGRMSQHAELSRSELSHAMRFRSMSMDATALPTDKDAPDVAFSRSQSECGVNNPEPTSLANSNSSTSSIPQAFSSLFNEINLNMDLNDFKEDEEESKVFGFGAGKVKSSLSTIPSETNLEASMYDASCLISHEIPRMDGESPKEKTLFRDNDDLNRLKKRVMNMRASMLS
ncbi:DEKNAAC105669 [Brettanomyces naardenensis]|uniref:DEKNAAC105669 n=1 Tax=Brettanomyces naardenensis TaxID=13370 RepID=A0A448YU31_BRENA|nr:DEKNAAC105669 [Brettanomyces naardenensis]